MNKISPGLLHTVIDLGGEGPVVAAGVVREGDSGFDHLQVLNMSQDCRELGPDTCTVNDIDCWEEEPVPINKTLPPPLLLLDVAGGPDGPGEGVAEHVQYGELDIADKKLLLSVPLHRVPEDAAPLEGLGC